MNICFLDKTSFTYNSNDVDSYKLRGAETVLINIANSLTKLGHHVTVFNNCKRNEQINHIDWININNLTRKFYFDLAGYLSDALLFDFFQLLNIFYLLNRCYIF